MFNYCFITVGRNCEDWVDKSLGSIASQNFDKNRIKVIVTDDASTDSSPEKVAKIATENGWQYILNTERKYALYNQYRAIHLICESDEDVVVFVDMDDWLIDGEVLNELEKHYSSPDVLLTYGSFATSPPSNAHMQPAVKPYPKSVIESRDFRPFSETNGLYWNHLRTFRYGPFKEITQKDLTYPDGRGFFTASPDTAIMTPMMELVGPRHRYIEKQLLVYNSEQAEPDWKTHLPQIREADKIIYSLPKKELWQR